MVDPCTRELGHGLHFETVPGQGSTFNRNLPAA